MIEQPIDHSVTTMDGETFSLQVYRGMPLLIVNTACRDDKHTDQFGELQKLYEIYSERGFEIADFILSRAALRSVLSGVLDDAMRWARPIALVSHADDLQLERHHRQLHKVSDRCRWVRDGAFWPRGVSDVQGGARCAQVRTADVHVNRARRTPCGR